MAVKWKPSGLPDGLWFVLPSPWCNYRTDMCGSLLTVQRSNWSDEELEFDDL